MQSTKKFLILTQYYAPEIGAPQVRFRAFTKELRKLGHSVEVVTAMPNHPTGKIFDAYRGKLSLIENANSVKVHRYWMYAAQGSGLKRLLSYLSFCFVALFALFKVEKPDYIFVESPPLFLGITGWIYSVVLRAPVIFNVADLWPDSVRDLGMIGDGFVFKLSLWLEKKIYKKSKYVNAVTEGILKTLEEKKMLNKNQLTFLPNGVDLDLFYPGPKNPQILQKYHWQNKRVFIYAGTIGFAQGLEYMIYAMGILERDTNYGDLLFVLVGDGGETQKLKKIVADKNIKNVQFIGIQSPEAISELLRSADFGYVCLLDLPLFEGARPSKIFPKMATGIPILYAGKGEGARIINSVKAGLVCLPQNVEDHVEKIKDLVKNYDDYKERSRLSQNYIHDHYSWEVNVRKWLETL